MHWACSVWIDVIPQQTTYYYYYYYGLLIRTKTSNSPFTPTPPKTKIFSPQNQNPTIRLIYLQQINLQDLYYVKPSI